MNEFEWVNDEAAILSRFDRSSPDALLRSLAAEFRRLHEANARLVAQMEVMVSLSTMADRIRRGEIEEIGAEHPSTARIAADHYLAESSGFYPIEYDRAGRPYRWTGPSKHFSFQIFVQRRKPSRFLLVFDNFFVEAAQEEFRCFVDGEPTALKMHRAADHFEALGLLPTRADNGATAIVFVCPRTGSPQELGNVDPRKLGLSFRLLAIDALPNGEIDNRAGPQ